MLSSAETHWKFGRVNVPLLPLIVFKESCQIINLVKTENNTKCLKDKIIDILFG